MSITEIMIRTACSDSLLTPDSLRSIVRIMLEVDAYGLNHLRDNYREVRKHNPPCVMEYVRTVILLDYTDDLQEILLQVEKLLGDKSKALYVVTGSSDLICD